MQVLTFADQPDLLDESPRLTFQTGRKETHLFSKEIEGISHEN